MLFIDQKNPETWLSGNASWSVDLDNQIPDGHFIVEIQWHHCFIPNEFVHWVETN